MGHEWGMMGNFVKANMVAGIALQPINAPKHGVFLFRQKRGIGLCGLCDKLCGLCETLTATGKKLQRPETYFSGLAPDPKICFILKS